MLIYCRIFIFKTMLYTTKWVEITWLVHLNFRADFEQNHPSSPLLFKLFSSSLYSTVNVTYVEIELVVHIEIIILLTIRHFEKLYSVEPGGSTSLIFSPMSRPVYYFRHACSTRWWIWSPQIGLTVQLCISSLQNHRWLAVYVIVRVHWIVWLSFIFMLLS